MTDQDPKVKALRERGTMNPDHLRVRDPLFRESDFFDPRDVVQVKYEMLRSAAEGSAVSQAAADHGFSRPTFYKAQEDFQKEGLAGLVPRKRGPRGAHKLTAEVMEFIEATLNQREDLGAAVLAELVGERFGISVHSRSVERALARRKKDS